MGIKLKHPIFLLSVLSGVQPKLNVNYMWGINFEFTELRSMSKRVQFLINYQLILCWYLILVLLSWELIGNVSLFYRMSATIAYRCLIYKPCAWGSNSNTQFLCCQLLLFIEKWSVKNTAFPRSAIYFLGNRVE